MRACTAVRAYFVRVPYQGLFVRDFCPHLSPLMRSGTRYNQLPDSGRLVGQGRFLGSARLVSRIR